jgi:hypothetical protein
LKRPIDLYLKVVDRLLTMRILFPTKLEEGDACLGTPWLSFGLGLLGSLHWYQRILVRSRSISCAISYGIKALHLKMLLGYRQIHEFGYESVRIHGVVGSLASFHVLLLANLKIPTSNCDFSAGHITPRTFLMWPESCYPSFPSSPAVLERRTM